MRLSDFYNPNNLKTSQDIQKKIMSLVAGNLKKDAPEGIEEAIHTLVNAAIARGQKESLSSIDSKYYYGWVCNKVEKNFITLSKVCYYGTANEAANFFKSTVDKEQYKSMNWFRISDSDDNE